MKLENARIEPLPGKYYGTEVSFDTDREGEREYVIVWIMGNFNPSEREAYERDGKYYYKDEDGDEWEYEICDSHYETETGYEVAKLLVEAINSRKENQ